MKSGYDQPSITAPVPGIPHEIAPGILWVRLPLPFALNHVNVYLIEDEGGWALFDTGLANPQSCEIWRKLLAEVVAPSRLTKIIASHFHGDHVGLAGWLSNQTGAAVYMSRKERALYERFSLQHGGQTTDAARDFYISNGLDPITTDTIIRDGKSYLSLVTELSPNCNLISSGDSLSIGDDEFNIITGGGHSPEQIMLLNPRRGIFIAADQILARISPNVSVWQSEPDADPLNEYLASLIQLRADVNDASLVLPGHGSPFQGLHQRSRDLEVHHHERCGLIADAIQKQPLSAGDLLPIVFRRKLDQQQRGFAFGEVLAHTNYLVGKGIARWTEEAVRRLEFV